MSTILRIGTRRSDLALTQTNMVGEALLSHFPDLKLEVVPILTSGDQKQGTSAAAHGDKKDWVAEIEQALVADRIDFAVHSAKDVPVDLAPETDILPTLSRATPHDVLITRVNEKIGSFRDLPRDAALGTASLRRVAQLKRLRRDFALRAVRGNVPTRVRKLDEDPTLAGIVLAAAGVSRLGLNVQLTKFSTAELVPAVNQGILAVQFLSSRNDVRERLERLIEPRTLHAFNAERACVAALGADCKSALGVYAESRGDSTTLTVRVLSADGSEILEETRSALNHEAVQLGADVATKLLEQGAAELLSGRSLLAAR
ncbi:MAG: hydroxymethylbilane synthase [Bdellovibrionota bacterium]